MAILIIATEHDPHTVAVMKEIDGLGGEYVVADLSEFPQQAQLAVGFSCCGDRDLGITLRGRRIDLDTIGSAWWRRPQQPRISADVQGDTHRLFAANETAEALAGLWHALDSYWVNEPRADHVAHRKITQLRVAQEVGLRLPTTLITNDPDEARRFIDAHGYQQVIYKSFSALEQAWRETRRIRAEELELIDSVRYAPVIFQEYVEAIYDVRITIVGDELFPAAIYSQQTGYPTDFRMEMDRATIEPCELPAEVADRLRRLMARLGLRYGAVDMRLRPDGAHVFLEVNPAGQWLFIEEVTRQPIAASLARLLVEHDAGSRERSVSMAGVG
jgi:glutathione synthase/RimK-type ligase-like ATP-grasp enzyme